MTTERSTSISPGTGQQEDAPARRSRRVRRPGQDLRPRRQGSARAQGRLSQGRLRRRPDAAAASPAEGRLPLEDRADAWPKCACRELAQGRRPTSSIWHALKEANVVPAHSLQRARSCCRASISHAPVTHQGRAACTRGRPAAIEAAGGKIESDTCTVTRNSQWPPNPPTAAPLSAFGEMTRFAELQAAAVLPDRRR